MVADRAGHNVAVEQRGRHAGTSPWPGRPGFLACWNGSAVDAATVPPQSPELNCLRGVLPPNLLEAARRRAGELGTGADQVLIRWGVIDETTYLHRLARHLRIAPEDFAQVGRDDTPLCDDQMRFAAAAGVMPLRQNGDLVWAMAPRRMAARTLCGVLHDHPSLRSRFRVAPQCAMQQFLQQTGQGLAQHASFGLQRRYPALAVSPCDVEIGWRTGLRRAAAGALLAAALPLLCAVHSGVVTALLFLGFIGLRLAASLQPRPPAPRSARRPDDALPIYTAIAALYREAASVASLVEAIEALDYPREKLDIILVVELDDLATRAAIARLGPRPHLRVLIAPAVGPRTKPKALNYALPFVRGGMVTVFDAEDRPEPDQLRAALDAFARGGPTTGCVQAGLCIDNITHSWLSRLFLAEYAGQFEAVLPGLTRLGLPLPLGGSSNHFRTAVLREVGGWDAYNVTEDADLGFRLARFGYSAISFDSRTFEEAPIGLAAWLGQRTRWMKGWMQTWCVHMRRPRLFWRDAGWRGVLALNLFVGGSVLSALIHPLLLLDLATTGLALAQGEPLSPPSPWASLHGLAVAAGYVGSAVVAAIGLKRIGRLHDAAWLLLMPLYWICLSIAAWRALGELVWKPHHWQKTEHGVAARAAPSPKAVGKTLVRDSASDPRRPLRASASC
ncbi:glycosyl transferases [Rhodopseudomonas palustris HaA2]|uniref:Glycosyl transferases n=1 Tax=Rhodopseudomonas palustris (strain HaA2) TaxID=316058 RepID=Q2J1R3_RHOP2|nr:glycosyltransferase [Rhodopseudomonas palustris]ABD05597.1 glycosyl transferases [Rhodopseudomonas palustris HaA2]